MTTLVLTLVGEDRAGLVAQVADIVANHDGNWERSELAELAGTFAGVVEVSVAAERVDELRAALEVLAGLLAITVHESPAAAPGRAPQTIELRVLGNDHPGIVRELSSALRAQGASIDRLTSATRDAAMSGGRLFEATIVARVPASTSPSAVIAEIERLAAEIQVDLTLGD
ncbi:glycine cleavage system regulatory protein [Microbacterium aoyamense]|uniref:Glycine cleavage system regulatory protein n=1 Tax=Microbacterium aoyamense TaxID=344166 RepID=A0ABN2PHQ8_9MICO|nr:ACT domain-containing protein [Microbacterium aoyamense]